VPAGPVEGPCVLAALDRDAVLTNGQKETLRSIYKRFVATESLPTQPTPPISVGETIDVDPRLSRGQREALRTMFGSFKH
jgi:hypothetical protein